MGKKLWLRWNLASNQVEEGPFTIAQGADFQDLPEQFKTNGIDGALNQQSDSDNVYLFSTTTQDDGHDKEWSGKFQKWDMQSDTTVGAFADLVTPGSTKGLFKDLPQPFDKQIKAALNLQPQNATSYLFSNVINHQAIPTGVLVQVFDAQQGKPVGEAFNMSLWSNMPEPFITHIDAAVNRGRFGYEAYFFSGSHWMLWDMMKEEVVEGPFDMVEHHTFQPLMKTLNLCSGHDLQTLGQDSMLAQAIRSTVPHPKAVVSKLVGASGKSGYADTVPERGGATSDVHSVAATALSIPEIRFNNPSDIEIEGAGTPDAVAFVVDTNNHAIRRVHLASGNTTTVAGGGYGTGFMDGVGAAAKFRFPTGLSVVRRDGNTMPGDVLYVADTGNDAIRRVFIPQNSDVGTVLTVAGGAGKQCASCQRFEDVMCTGCCQCNQAGFVDGRGIDAMFNKPADVSVLYNRTAVGITSNEFIYVADRDNHAIRRIIVKPGMSVGDTGGSVVTIAGGARDNTTAAPVAGYNDGFGSEAQFSHPSSISALRVTPPELRVPSYDTLYVADTHNKALRRVVMPLVSTVPLKSHVFTTGDANIVEEAQRERVQNERMATQKEHLASLAAQHLAAEEKAAEEEEAVQDEAALQPSSRQLFQIVKNLGEAEADPGLIPPIAPRYTADGGTAPKDTPCRLPFTHGGRAYNDCIDNVGKIDLSLVIKCEDWMSNALNHWDSDPLKTGQVKRSNHLTVHLKGQGSLPSEWSFAAYRKVKSVAFRDFKTLEDPQPWNGDLVKNTMCMRQTQNPEQGLYTSEECCSTKYGPLLVKPCDGAFPECSPLHNKVLNQWQNAKSDLEDDLNQF